MQKIRNNKGFTLIELMIVVVIIGILAAIAIPRFTAVSTQAKQAEAGPILKQICTLADADLMRDITPANIDAITGWDTTINDNAEYFDFSYVGGVATATANGVDDAVGTQTMTCATGVISAPAVAAG